MRQAPSILSDFYRRQLLHRIFPILATGCLIYWLAGGIPPVAWRQFFQACAHFSILWASDGVGTVFVLLLLLVQALFVALAWGSLLWLLVREAQILRAISIPQLKLHSQQSTSPTLPQHEISPSSPPATQTPPVAAYIQPDGTPIPLVQLLEPLTESDFLARAYQPPIEQPPSLTPTWQQPFSIDPQPLPADQLSFSADVEEVPTSPLPTLSHADPFDLQPDAEPLPAASQQQAMPSSDNIPAVPNTANMPNIQPFALPSLQSIYTSASMEPPFQLNPSQPGLAQDDDDDDDNPFAFDNPFGGSLPDVFQPNNKLAMPIEPIKPNKKRSKKRFS